MIAIAMIIISHQWTDIQAIITVIARMSRSNAATIRIITLIGIRTSITSAVRC